MDSAISHHCVSIMQPAGVVSQHVSACVVFACRFVARARVGAAWFRAYSCAAFATRCSRVCPKARR
eukprot:11223797-Lingulodinium_polyedra.AAC.1